MPKDLPSDHQPSQNRPFRWLYFLTPKEAGEISGLGEGGIRRRLYTANGPPWVKRGQKILLPKTEFLEWASRQVIP